MKRERERERERERGRTKYRETEKETERQKEMKKDRERERVRIRTKIRSSIEKSFSPVSDVIAFVFETPFNEPSYTKSPLRSSFYLADVARAKKRVGEKLFFTVDVTRSLGKKTLMSIGRPLSNGGTWSVFSLRPHTRARGNAFAD